jgi:hypothetical protein
VTDNDYWLARWLDEHGIRNKQSARRFLKDPRHIEDLRDTASAIPWDVEPLADRDKSTIVAGRTIDLSGELGCFSPKCMQGDVDTLFSRAWHYFDTIVVVGLAPQYAQYLLKDFSDHSLERFLAFVETFFYIRKIGAEDILVYRQKPPACVCHLQRRAEEYAATGVIEQRASWIESFAAEAKVSDLEQDGDHWHYAVTHPDMKHTSFGSICAHGRKGGKPGKAAIFGDIFDVYAGKLVSDIGTARTIQSPLGAASSIHAHLLSRAPMGAPSVQDALFELDLPVLYGVPAKDLIKIRQDKWQYFDAFRIALRSAANEFIANAPDGAQAADIARQIEDDLIEPELVKIRRELRVSADILTRKSAVSMPVGALATTIGLLDKVPLVAAGSGAIVAAASMASFLIDYKKYVDDKRGVLERDMYFLWHAQRVTDRRKRLHL